jgi:multiple sugar transport system ATP-binding protein
MLSEALGSEVNVHMEIAARPVITDDTRELAEDVGAGHHIETHERRRSDKSRIVGRFNPRTRVSKGDLVEASVDARALHFFDLESGLGIYDGETTQDEVREKGRQVAA